MVLLGSIQLVLDGGLCQLNHQHYVFLMWKMVYKVVLQKAECYWAVLAKVKLSERQSESQKLSMNKFLHSHTSERE